MNKRYRKAIIAGNWKMNNTVTETKELINSLKQTVGKAKGCEVVLGVPFVNLQAAIRATKDCKITIAAQNMHFEKSGAFTGEISGGMLRDLGVKYVIIGHSERRQYFGETDTTVNLKVKAALEVSLKPIICVGESLEQRELGVTTDVINAQIKIALNGISKDNMRKIVVAYEPIWAIGTGKTATADQAAEVCSQIRATIRSIYGARIARSVTIQYGGSMNAKNAAELLSKQDVDGGLIGGASLKAADFTAIVEAANV